METHSLRDVGRNSGYVRLDGTMTWSLEDWADTVLHNASSWRNVMNKRNLVLCMLNYEYAPRKKPRRKNTNKVQEQWYESIPSSIWDLLNYQTWRCDLRSAHEVSRKRSLLWPIHCSLLRYLTYPETVYCHFEPSRCGQSSLEYRRSIGLLWHNCPPACTL